jgi:hypothetical protein
MRVALRIQIQLGMKNFEKYSAQFKHNTVQTSPVSTVPELYTDLPETGNSMEQLKKFYEKIPHHQAQLSKQTRKTLKNIWDWDTIIPTPTLLAIAFPGVRIPEANPSILYYNSVDGARYKREGKHIGQSDKGKNHNLDGGVYGMNTPFKGQEQFFGGFKGEWDVKPTAIGVEDPNILYSIATLQPPGLESDFFCSRGLLARQPPIGMVVSSNNNKQGRQDSSDKIGGSFAPRSVPNNNNKPAPGGTNPGNAGRNTPSGFPARPSGGPPGGSGGGHGGPPGGYGRSGGSHGSSPPGHGGLPPTPGGIRRGFNGGDPPGGNSDPGGTGPASSGPAAGQDSPPLYGTMIPTI